MPGKFNLAFMDYDRERATFGVHTVVITDANFVAQDAFMDALKAAVDAVTLGQIYKDTRTYEVDYAIPSPPATPTAQRELKWLVKGYDSVLLTPWSVEIPTADLTLLEENTGRMDPLDAAYTTLVSAIQDLALSIAGNTVVVEEIVLVGRNL